MTGTEAEGQGPQDPVEPASNIFVDSAPHEDASLFPGKLIFWVPLVPLIVLDLWSKTAAFAYLLENNGGIFSFASQERVFATDWVDFDLVNYLNRGTIWGLGEEYHSYLKVLRFAAIGFILYFVYRTPASRKMTLLSLSLIMAGAIGNLYDNMFTDIPQFPQFEGAVRDFIHFHNVPHWNFPAFNVADSCITVGAIALFLILWRTPAPLPRPEESLSKEES